MISRAAGLLLVDKPAGWTSHDVVAVVRKLFPRETKVGHSGTLDPMATGLLLLLIGRATRRAAHFQGLPKVYSGSLRLGIETETGDMEGKVLARREPPAIDAGPLGELMESYHGEVELPVPRFSAVKYKGKPLYHYARKGIETPEKTRISRIMEWRLLSWSPPEARFRVRCSSGTYIRALAIEIGRKLGCGAVLNALRRESVGGFSVERSWTIEALRAAAKTGPRAVSELLEEAAVGAPANA